MKPPETRNPYDTFVFCARLALLALLIQQSWFFLTEDNLVKMGCTPVGLHAVHLVFHEAGHVLLSWGPRLLCMLGGTLGQLAMPLAFGVSFALKRNWFAVAVFVWLFGHSVVDCAPYINDARALQLDLISGGTGAEVEGHDWEYILTRLDLLPATHRIARAVLLTGRGILLAALAFLAGWIVWHSPYGPRKAVLNREAKG